ncbi:MAG: sulfatase-like hydrolase/transferase [Clostridium sp.]|nr:sulfatase-like hydrolase/transferase [Prevotella sp.]MCM1428674.1 sulfatase-like hydrolase/transferase [Clostridium sp.]MCM1475803.1 sulfatase-like hydrolase/transferase [Muribaculaceae bacterium]
MIYIIYTVVTFTIFLVVTLLYRLLSKGLSKAARGQQTTRFSIGSLLAMIPLFIAAPAPLGPYLWLAATIAFGWAITFPLLAWISDRHVSSDIDHFMDFASGFYIFSMLASLCMIVDSISPIPFLNASIISIVEVTFAIPLIFQWVYFFLYKGKIDDVGMKVVTDTNINEIIEFTRAYPKLPTIGVALLSFTIIAGIFFANLSSARTFSPLSWWQIALEAFALVAVAWISFKRKNGALWRPGVVRLFLDTREYRRSTLLFRQRRQKIAEDLSDIRQLGATPDKPSTVLLIIGESASRDYMSAFSPQDRETTPWLSASIANDPRHFMTIPHSYSCALQTVPALERALTEKNQYNDKLFHESCSIVDIAHSLGYKVRWFSNQGHIGAADSSVSIVAETSDTAQWTLQQVGKVHYDQSLIDMLATVNPEDNNFVVLHLKGSHFNFINRYPKEATVWGEPGVQDNILNYQNSIRYTDSILRRAFEYAQEHLNLQAMVYFSDHATFPDKHRSPRFDGFGQCRIPAFIYMSEEYIVNHPTRHEALCKNREKYFTNDLAYELICGLFDVATSRFDETNSILSLCYRHSRDTLLTSLGTVHISEDNSKP